MRVRVLVTALTVMAVGPVWAQTRPALASRTVLPAHVMCADQLVPAIPVPTVRISGPHYVVPRLALSRGGRDGHRQALPDPPVAVRLES